MADENNPNDPNQLDDLFESDLEHDASDFSEDFDDSDEDAFSDLDDNEPPVRSAMPDKSSMMNNKLLLLGGLILASFVLFSAIGFFSASAPESTLPPVDASLDAEDFETIATEDPSGKTPDFNMSLMPQAMDELPAPQAKPPVAQQPTVAPAATTTPPSASVPTTTPLASLPQPEARIEPEPTPITVDLSPIEHQLDQQQQFLTNLKKDLNKSQDAMHGRLRKVEEQVRHMANDMDAVSRQVGQVNDDIEDIHDKVDALSEQFNTLSDGVSDTSEASTTRIEGFASPAYRIHAVIPGRAWLKRRDGTLLTVTEGDALDPYGKILAIDAPAAAVITSSGVTLR